MSTTVCLSYKSWDTGRVIKGRFQRKDAEKVAYRLGQNQNNIDIKIDDEIVYLDHEDWKAKNKKTLILKEALMPPQTYSLPVEPKPGSMVRDSAGVVWTHSKSDNHFWYDESSTRVRSWSQLLEQQGQLVDFDPDDEIVSRIVAIMAYGKPAHEIARDILGMVRATLKEDSDE